jgi:hypothetical protein
MSRPLGDEENHELPPDLVSFSDLFPVPTVLRMKKVDIDPVIYHRHPIFRDPVPVNHVSLHHIRDGDDL